MSTWRGKLNGKAKPLMWSGGITLTLGGALAILNWFGVPSFGSLQTKEAHAADIQRVETKVDSNTKRIDSLETMGIKVDAIHEWVSRQPK